MTGRIEGGVIVWERSERGRRKRVEAEPAPVDSRLWHTGHGPAVAHAAMMDQRWGVVLVAGVNELVGWLIPPDSPNRASAVVAYRELPSMRVEPVVARDGMPNGGTER